MKILIVGATGMIGRALVLRLARDGHDVRALVRSLSRAESTLGQGVTLLGPDAQLDRVVAEVDAVVNLAGEPVAGARWTEARKRALRLSRVDLTRGLVEAMARTSRRPRVLVNASAVGFYGDRGDEALTEDSGAGSGFLATLTRDWEAAALEATPLGVRVVCLRLGVVLGADGGALDRLVLPFSLGLGGPLGSGRQHMPWVHVDDVAEVVARALEEDRLRGPINVVAPESIDNRTFARALGRALGRPAVIPVPALALRALFGEAASVMTSSQRVAPTRLNALGHTFLYPALSQALEGILSPPQGPRIDRAAPDAPTPYLARRGAMFRLRHSVLIEAPIDEVFAFFSTPRNLGLLTPLKMRFTIRSMPARMEPEARIEYSLRVVGMTLRWTTRIESFTPPTSFVDVQERGPYRAWWHEHRFEAQGQSTWMHDTVYYRPPFGLLGRLANRLFITPSLKRIFAFRASAIGRRFVARAGAARAA